MAVDTSMCRLLLLVAIAVFMINILTESCRSESIAVAATGKVIRSLEYYLCEENWREITQQNWMELLLSTDVTHYINSGSGCVIQNLNNVSIKSDTPGKRAEIKCKHTNEFSFFTNRGFSFLNCSNLSLSDLSFTQCGGVLSHESFLYENITEVPAYFGTNQSAVLFFSETLDLKLLNISINDYYGFAVIAANSYGSPSFRNLLIFNSLGAVLCPLLIVNHTRGNYTCYGSGVLVYSHDSNISPYHNLFTHNTLHVADCLFKDNSYWSNDYICTYNVFQFNPDRVPLVGAGGMAVFLTQAKFQYEVFVDNSTIANNSGTIVGGLLASYINSPQSSSLTITNTTFAMNYNLISICPGTALSSYIYFSEAYLSSYALGHSQTDKILVWRPLFIHNTKVVKHFSRSGIQSSSTVYILMASQSLFDVVVELERVEFVHNRAFFTGICLLAENSYRLIENIKPLNLKMTDVNAEQNHQYFGEHVIGAMTNSSQFVFTRLGRVTITGSSLHGSSFISNIGSVLQAYASDIYLTGNITFRNNIATKGAAIHLKSNSHIIIAENSTILFQNNQAYLDGGAIYANEIGTENYFCVLQVDSNVRNLTELNINVTFDRNTALRSGPSTYAAPLQHCFQTKVHVFPRYLENLYYKIFTFTGNTSRALASPAIDICPCVNNRPDCGKVFPTLSVYPGDSIMVSLIGIDSTGGSVFSQMNASFSQTNSTVLPLPGWWTDTDQEISTLFNDKCRNLKYRIHSITPNHEQTGRLNFAVPGLPPLAYQNISIMPCPAGFTLDKSKGECICEQFLSTLDIECNVDNKTLKPRKQLSWIGLIEDSIGYAPFCPLMYCNNSASAVLDMTLSIPSICLNNRNGVLCGSCKPGYSISLGPHTCIACSNYWLFATIIYAVAGILAVFVMFILNLTLQLGTTGGIIFYANLFTVSHLVQAETFLIPFMEPFSLINLEQAFSSCVYDGMTMSVKLGLQLAFSFYLWIIIAVVLIVARCSSWATKVLVQSSVQVLVTLIHLSFSRMLITVIEVFSSVTIITKDRQYLVWLADGTVEYGKGVGHIILLCVASVISALVILPYLLVGTLGSFGLRYRLVNKLRPFIDAIHGPYKDNRRYWFGARLILLVIVYITYAILRGRYPQEQQLLTAIFLVTFTIVQATIGPFEQELVGILDTWIMFNAIIMVCINLYSALGGKNSAYLLLVNLIMMLFTALAVLVYHIILLVKRIRKKPMLDTSGTAISTAAVHRSRSLASRNRTNYQSVRNDSRNRACALRESLLSDID